MWTVQRVEFTALFSYEMLNQSVSKPFDWLGATTKFDCRRWIVLVAHLSGEK